MLAEKGKRCQLARSVTHLLCWGHRGHSSVDEAIEELGPLIRQPGKQYSSVTLKEGTLLQDRPARGIATLDPEEEDVFPTRPS